jgi:hypothetical protein
VHWLTSSSIRLSLVALALIACGGDDPGSVYSGPSTADGVDSLEGSEQASETSSSEQEEGPLLDMDDGAQEATADDGMNEPQCAKVDVLYVIDNSPSMYEEQQTLIDNFGVFVSDMQIALADVTSYHVGVVTSDNYMNEGFLDDSTPVVNADHPDCRLLGGLVVQSQQGECTPFASGDNYITEQDVLEAEFGCVANVGEDGDSDERMGDALINAVNAGRLDTGCNRNFIRDDALLIVVMLTDENDSSNASTQEWFDTLAAAKGTEENVVMLSLIWDSSWNNCSSSLSESDGYTIEEFTQMFTNHAVGNICDGSYAGFFQNAIPTITGACENFVPVE